MKKKSRWAAGFNFPHAKFQTSSQRGSAAESKKGILDFWLSVPNSRGPGFHLVTLLNLPHAKGVQALPRGWNALFTTLGVYFQGFNRAKCQTWDCFPVLFYFKFICPVVVEYLFLYVRRWNLPHTLISCLMICTLDSKTEVLQALSKSIMYLGISFRLHLRSLQCKLWAFILSNRWFPYQFLNIFTSLIPKLSAKNSDRVFNWFQFPSKQLNIFLNDNFLFQRWRSCNKLSNSHME